jgi:hypothetical protein
MWKKVLTLTKIQNDMAHTLKECDGCKTTKKQYKLIVKLADELGVKVHDSTRDFSDDYPYIFWRNGGIYAYLERKLVYANEIPFDEFVSRMLGHEPKQEEKKPEYFQFAEGKNFDDKPNEMFGLGNNRPFMFICDGFKPNHIPKGAGIRMNLSYKWELIDFEDGQILVGTKRVSE